MLSQRSKHLGPAEFCSVLSICSKCFLTSRPPNIGILVFNVSWWLLHNVSIFLAKNIIFCGRYNLTMIQLLVINAYDSSFLHNVELNLYILDISPNNFIMLIFYQVEQLVWLSLDIIFVITIITLRKNNSI